MKFEPKDSVFENIKEETLVRVLYSSWDIQQALSSLTFLLEDCDFEKEYSKVELRRFKCYESTMIISFARPFEPARNYSVLSLKTLGIRLGKHEKELQDKLLYARRKIVAHSDEDMMHFKSYTFTTSTSDKIFIPNIIYDESLIFNKDELSEFETFFRELKYYMDNFIFQLAQKNTAMIEIYKKPSKTLERNS